MAFDPNRWTLKTQEALRDAIALAKDSHHAEVSPDHFLSAALAKTAASPSRSSTASGSPLSACATASTEPLAASPRPTAAAEPSLSRE